MYLSAPSRLQERWDRRAGGDVSVPPCVLLLQPPGTRGSAGGCSAGGGRSGSDGRVKPVRKLIWIKVKCKL